MSEKRPTQHYNVVFDCNFQKLVPNIFTIEIAKTWFFVGFIFVFVITNCKNLCDIPHLVGNKRFDLYVPACNSLKFNNILGLCRKPISSWPCKKDYHLRQMR